MLVEKKKFFRVVLIEKHILIKKKKERVFENMFEMKQFLGRVIYSNPKIERIEEVIYYEVNDRRRY
ncbi:MAG: hypothetical protein ACRDA3_13170 [Peptostreptococcaceae bacterium]